MAAYISWGKSCTSRRCPGHPTDDRQTHTKSSQQPPDWSKIHLDDRFIAWNIVVQLLGHVAIIAYDHLLLCNSLFQEVLKRSGTFEKSKKFSKIRQIWVGKKIQIENSRLEVEIRMSDAAMHRTLMRYCRTVYSCTRPEVVNIWHVCTHSVHCCVHCVHCTIFCVYTVYTVYTSSCTSARSSADFSAVENRRLKTWWAFLHASCCWWVRPLLLSWLKQN